MKPHNTEGDSSPGLNPAEREDTGRAQTAPEGMPNLFDSAIAGMMDDILKEMGWQTEKDFDNLAPGYVPPELRPEPQSAKPQQAGRPAAIEKAAEIAVSKSPAPRSGTMSDIQSQIMRDLGFPPLDEINDMDPNWIDPALRPGFANIRQPTFLPPDDPNDPFHYDHPENVLIRLVVAAERDAKKRLKLTDKQADALEMVNDPLYEIMAGMPDEERRPWLDAQIDQWYARTQKQSQAERTASNQPGQMSFEDLLASAPVLTAGVSKDTVATGGNPDGHVSNDICDASPATDRLRAIKAELGLPSIEDWADAEPGYVAPELRSKSMAAKPQQAGPPVAIAQAADISVADSQSPMSDRMTEIKRSLGFRPMDEVDDLAPGYVPMHLRNLGGTSSDGFHRAAFRVLEPIEKAVVRSLRDGSTVVETSIRTGLSSDEVEEIWGCFLADFRQHIIAAARSFIQSSLAS